MVRGNWGWAGGAEGQSGWRSGSLREAHLSAVRCLGSCVLHAAPGGKGNGPAQLNTSSVFIKRNGHVSFGRHKECLGVFFFTSRALNLGVAPQVKAS